MKHFDFMLLDILCLHLAFLFAYVIRYGWTLSDRNPDYYNLALVLTLVDIVVLVLNDSMKNVLKRGIYKECSHTVKHAFLVMAIAMLYLFVMKATAVYSRIFIAVLAVCYVFLAWLVRLGWKTYLLHSKRKANNPTLYIISTCDRVDAVVKRYVSEKVSQYQLIGVCLLDLDQTGTEIMGIPINTNQDNVLSYLCREWVDEVLISIPSQHAYPTDLVDKLVEMGIVVHIEMEKSTKLEWQRQEFEKIAGRQVLTVGLSMASPLQIYMKRGLDIIGGIIGCLLTLVLTVIIGPMIYIKSPGPIFFAQTRVGKNGKQFKMYKFRSMYLDAEERKAELMAENRVGSGLMFKLDYDPRIIGCERLPDGTVKKGIGNFIRDYSLDEFPQFWNCLKGDISLVGTRPPTVDEWEKYELHHRARLAIKPGITGMWQVSGRSEITDFEQVVELDKKYIREWNFGLDIKLLLLTVKAVISKDGSM
jgi:exopolysaccharide biosynthesis polyprenyl glycosylphosphotransferase